MVIINYWAVLVAAAAGFLLGWLWYGPLFGRKWAHLMGMSMEMSPEKKRQAMKGYAATLLGALVMAYVLAHFVNYAGAYMASDGAALGAWAWLGFFATSALSGVFFEGRKWTLYFINVGYYLVELVVMGMILAAWR